MQQNTRAKFCIFINLFNNNYPLGFRFPFFDFIQAKRDVTPAVMTIGLLRPLAGSETHLLGGYFRRSLETQKRPKIGLDVA